MENVHHIDVGIGTDQRTKISQPADCLIIVDETGHILEVNGGYSQLIGYTSEELLTMHISAIDATYTADEVKKQSEEILQYGSLQYESRHLHKNGTTIDIEVSTSHTPLHGGSFFLFIRDISHQKQTERILRETEEKYRLLFDSAGDNISVMTLQGKMLTVNSCACKMLGYSYEELLNIPIDQLDAKPELLPENIQKVITFGYYKGETELVCKDGTTIPVSVDARKIDWEGQPAIMSICRDITDRKRAEKALRQSEERFRSIMSLSPDIISIISKDGALIYNSPASLQIHGYSQDEMQGRNTFDLIHPDDQEHITIAFNNILSNPSLVVSTQYRYKNKDGSYIWMECSASNQIANPLINGIVAISRSIELRKQEESRRLELEQQYLNTQKLESLTVLAGGIAHDFNNLLSVIIGHCGLAKLRPTNALESISPIEKAAEHAAQLCQQMLAYAGKTQFVENRVNMSLLVEEMIETVHATVGNNVKITQGLSSGIPLITADANQIRQIVMNLIINASEAIGDGQGKIIVSLTKTEIREEHTEKDHRGNAIPPGQYVCLEVTDNGSGMDDETKKRIFEPFYTTKFTGRGLGMSAVLGIIASHKGALQLFSQPKSGSIFKVYLPIQTNVSTDIVADKNTDKPEQWQGRGTVLMVEDEEQVLLIAKTMLEELGFNVITATNGKEALEAYRNNDSESGITLVVTDIGMPVMDGCELIRELKILRPDLPIIISTGFGKSEVTCRIECRDMAGFICKPYNFEQFREVIKSVVRG